MKENLEQRQDPKMLAAGSQEMAGSQINCLQMLTWTENLRLSMYGLKIDRVISLEEEVKVELVHLKKAKLIFLKKNKK